MFTIATVAAGATYVRVDWREKAQALMRVRGISRLVLADKLGVHASTILRWLGPEGYPDEAEQDPPIGKAACLADALGLTVSELLDDSVPLTQALARAVESGEGEKQHADAKRVMDKARRGARRRAQQGRPRGKKAGA